MIAFITTLKSQAVVSKRGNMRPFKRKTLKFPSTRCQMSSRIKKHLSKLFMIVSRYSTQVYVKLLSTVAEVSVNELIPRVTVV